MKKFILFEKTEVHYELIGKGNPVMLVHGFGEDSSVWDIQIEQLKEKFQLIVPDLPGTAESALLPATSMEFLADALYAILKNEGISSLSMIGHSMGGYVTLAFVEKYGSLLKSFGLFHSTAFPDSEEKIEARRKSIAFIKQHGAAKFIEQSTPNLFSPNTKEKNPSLVEEFVRQNTNFSVDTLVSYYEAMIQRPDRTKLLKEARVPVMFIIGRHDKAIPLDQSLQQSHFPEISDVMVLENSGHQGMLEEPEKSTAFLEKFLSENEIVRQG